MATYDRYIPKGWEQTVALLEGLISANYPDTEILQIKEKFAGLRVYYFPGNDDIDAWIVEADNLCGRTCQNCGEGNATAQSDKGWMATLCTTCYTHWVEDHRAENIGYGY